MQAALLELCIIRQCNEAFRDPVVGEREARRVTKRPAPSHPLQSLCFPLVECVWITLTHD